MEPNAQQPQLSPPPPPPPQHQTLPPPAFTLIPVEVHQNAAQFESEFLQIEEYMMDKLGRIEQSKAKQVKASAAGKPQDEQREEQAQIRRQFVGKLKQWQRQRQEVRVRKAEVEGRRARQREEERERREREEQQERQFLRLQKKKQLEQKIQEIEERRQQREQSLKNALLKRSYNKLPSPSPQQQRGKQEQESIEISIRLLKSRRRQGVDPEELRVQEKAYIQRIKERLNMAPRQEGARSDFEVYLRRREERREGEGRKEKMRKYQERIDRVPIRISEEKKEQKLIEIDKITNPQKYRLLSNKLLNDKLIFQEFKNFHLNVDRKELGMNYLKELKQMHEGLGKRSKRSSSQIISKAPEEKLPVIHRKQQPLRAKEASRSVELGRSSSYKSVLEKDRAKDSRYMRALREKLALAVDI